MSHTFCLADYKATAANNIKNKSHPVNNHKKASLSQLFTFLHCGQIRQTPQTTRQHRLRRLQLYQPPAPCYIITHYGKKTLPQPSHASSAQYTPPRQPPIRIRGGDHTRASSLLPPTPTSTRGRTDAPRSPLTHCGCLRHAPRRLLLRPPRLRPHL